MPESEKFKILISLKDMTQIHVVMGLNQCLSFKNSSRGTHPKIL